MEVTGKGRTKRREGKRRKHEEEKEKINEKQDMS